MKTNIIIVLAVGVVGILIGTTLTSNTNDQLLTTPDSADFVSVRPAVDALPSQSVSADERATLLYMREEEKLARDVYTTLYNKWGLGIFSNIAQSEQTHTEAVRTLLVKYNITDPVTDDSVGVFTNSDLAQLYTTLVARGEQSLTEALTVGALIEDLDINDIKNALAQTDNDDITLVYENLMRGSRNHLRSFVSQLGSRGTTYEPQYISQSEFDAIISSPRETGSGASDTGNGRGWGGR